MSSGSQALSASASLRADILHSARGDLEVRDHAERVDAGIGPAGAMDAGMAGKQLRQRGLDLLLHAGADLLHLPAFVAGAVVGDGQFEFQGAHYGSRPAPSKSR